MHVWGCPCSGLESQLQDGHKLPKWKPWSYQAIFVGFSPHLLSLLCLVLNTRTGKSSPQFHVVFDNWITSVASVGGDEAFNPSQWQLLFTTLRYQYMFDLTDPNVLADECIDG